MVSPKNNAIARYSAKGRSNEGNLISTTNNFRSMNVFQGSTYTYEENIEVPEWGAKDATYSNNRRDKRHINRWSSILFR